MCEEAAAAVVHEVPEIACLTNEAECLQHRELIAIQHELQHDGDRRRGRAQDFRVRPFAGLMQPGGKVE